jgi:hypothetical protein
MSMNVVRKCVAMSLVLVALGLFAGATPDRVGAQSPSALGSSTTVPDILGSSDTTALQAHAEVSATQEMFAAATNSPDVEYGPYSTYEQAQRVQQGIRPGTFRSVLIYHYQAGNIWGGIDHQYWVYCYY